MHHLYSEKHLYKQSQTSRYAGNVFPHVLNFGVSPNLSVGPEVHMLKHFTADCITVKKGEPIEIPADIIGLPIPKIEWSKDDVLIDKPTETLLMETEVTGRLNAKTTLSIPAANRRDRGSYTVSASNNMGSAKHTVYVMVLGEWATCGEHAAK